MNIDDPKITAFALDELDEPEKSRVAGDVSQSLEGQRAVDETREIARLLKREFAAELNEKTKPRLSLSDIRDDPWFWGIGRPLAIAAIVAVFALVTAIVIGTYSRPEGPRSEVADYEIQAEQNSSNERVNLPALETIPNPISSASIQRIERVVIGEVNGDSGVENEEVHAIETISDTYRITQLRQRLNAPVISKRLSNNVANRCYVLIFLDASNRIVAGSRFCYMGNSEFVLEPVKNAYERDGHYFIGGSVTLPGGWRSGVDYSQYVIQFPDWIEAIGYAPGA